MKRWTEPRFLHPRAISYKLAESDKLSTCEKWLVAGMAFCLTALIIIAAFWQYTE